MSSRWRTVQIRREAYEILKRMAEVEHRSLANMNQECIIYYFARKHRDLKID